MQAGHTITKAVEFDTAIANTYKQNHPQVEVIVDDIRNIESFPFRDADIIIGGPPCQGFSMAGARIRHGFVDDPRNYLFKHYFNIVCDVRPKMFILENVKGILTMQKGGIFDEIGRLFTEAGYSLFHRIVKATDYGVPQKRERMILIGALNNDLDFFDLWNRTRQQIHLEQPGFFDSVSVADAISNLGPTTLTGEIENPLPVTNYQRYLASSKATIANHTQTKHSDMAVNRMRRVGNGENFTVLAEQINSIHSGSYGRLCWDEPAPTITTRFDTPTGGRFIHPEQHRTLSPREAARIQSFPDDFIFYGTRTSICKQIGNAVPPKVSYFLARLVANAVWLGAPVQGHNLRPVGQIIGGKVFDELLDSAFREAMLLFITGAELLNLV